MKIFGCKKNKSWEEKLSRPNTTFSTENNSIQNESEIQLTPDELIRESEILFTFQNLLITEKSRYESQANKLLEEISLHTKIVGYDLSYRINSDTYECRITNLDKSGNSYAIEVPIPNSQAEKIETLVELFAQTEAGFIH